MYIVYGINRKIDLDPKIGNFYPIFDPAGPILRQITETDLEEWLFKSIANFF